VSRRQHIRNIDIQEPLGVMTDLQHSLRIRRLKYFGHVERMGQERHPHIALNGRVDGVRYRPSRGRPRKRWLPTETGLRAKGEDISGGYKISSKQAEVEMFCDEAAVARASVAKAISKSK